MDSMELSARLHIPTCVGHIVDAPLLLGEFAFRFASLRIEFRLRIIQFRLAVRELLFAFFQLPLAFFELLLAAGQLGGLRFKLRRLGFEGCGIRFEFRGFGIELCLSCSRFLFLGGQLRVLLVQGGLCGGNGFV